MRLGWDEKREKVAKKKGEEAFPERESAKPAQKYGLDSMTFTNTLTWYEPAPLTIESQPESTPEPKSPPPCKYAALPHVCPHCTESR